MMQQAPPRWVRLCLVAAALCPLVVAGGPEPLEDMLPHMEYARLFDAFHRWSRRNGKVYASAVEKRAALTSYYYNMNFVNKCNAQSNTTGFTCAANEFAGERHEAFNAARLRKFSEFKKQYSAEATHDPSVLASVQLPDSLDWSTTGALLPVRNQGACGASYAFAAAAAVESLAAITSGRTLALSEQMLLSCKGDGGCGGGLPHNALGWVHGKGGLSSLAAYPYASGNGSAPACGCCGGAFGLCVEGQPECERALTCGGYFEVPTGDETLLLDAVAQQPVISGIDASPQEFMLYSSGVYRPGKPSGRGSGTNHAVLIVGYGTDDRGVPFWKVRNSWGDSWGMGGYALIERNAGAAGIGSYAVYPATPTLPQRCATPIDGDVRLSALPNGMATIYEKGAWKALCADDRHELVGAGHVICKQLGYDYASKAQGYKLDEPEKSGRVLLSGQRVCAPTDFSLLQCADRGDGQTCRTALGLECAPPADGSAAQARLAQAGGAMRVCGSAFVPGSAQPEEPSSPVRGETVLSASGTRALGGVHRRWQDREGKWHGATLAEAQAATAAGARTRLSGTEQGLLGAALLAAVAVALLLAHALQPAARAQAEAGAPRGERSDGRPGTNPKAEQMF